MRKMFFNANQFHIDRFNKEDVERTGITHSLILSHEDELGRQRASGIIDNPSDKICKKVKEAYERSKSMKCYVVDNNSLITKLLLDDEEYDF